MTLSIAELATTAQQQREQAATRQAAARKRAEKADKARQEAEAAVAAAESEEAEAGIITGRQFTTALRALTAEVREAQQAAEAAVASGGDIDIVGAWVHWRTLRARNRGCWSQLAGKYTEATGRNAPGGEWGYDTLEPNAPGRSLPFDKWLTQTVQRLEVEIETKAKRDTLVAFVPKV